MARRRWPILAFLQTERSGRRTTAQPTSRPIGTAGTTHLQQMAAFPPAPQHRSGAPAQSGLLQARAAGVLVVGFGLDPPIRCAEHEGRSTASRLKKRARPIDQGRDGLRPVGNEGVFTSRADGRLPRRANGSACGRNRETTPLTGPGRHVRQRTRPTCVSAGNLQQSQTGQSVGI